MDDTACSTILILTVLDNYSPNSAMHFIEALIEVFITELIFIVQPLVQETKN